MTEERKQEVRSTFVMGVVNCKNLEEAHKQIAEYFERENTTPSIEFFGGLELVEVIE